MADISSTNLDKFQAKFNRVADAGHQVEAKINKQGEAFLVKGKGKSRSSKVWFALKHPMVYHRDRSKSVQHKNVVNALNTAVKRDFGAFGLKSLERYLGQHKISGNTALSGQQVKGAVDFVKKMETLRQQEGAGNFMVSNQDGGVEFSRDIGKYLTSPVGENVLIQVNENNHSPENAFFRIESEAVLDILNGNEENETKYTALKMLVDRYVGEAADGQVNLSNSNRSALVRLIDRNRTFNDAQVEEAVTALKKAAREIDKLFATDIVGRLRKEPDNYLKKLDLETVGQRPQQFVLKIAGDDGNLKRVEFERLSLDAIKQEARRLEEQRGVEVEVEDVDDRPDKFAHCKEGLEELLRRTPGIKENADHLSPDEIAEINEMYSDDTELLVVNKAKEFLRERGHPN